MKIRRLETRLACFTVGALLVYFPAETYASWRGGLLDPFYLVDLVAMILLLWGALHSLQARPRRAPGVLCAGFAWASANGWRATSWRIAKVMEGGDLDFGQGEAWIVGFASAMALACFVISLRLVVVGGDGPTT